VIRSSDKPFGLGQDRVWSIKENREKKIRAGLYCAECGKQFTVTVGTIFEDSHIPLRKWLIAWYLLCSSKKDISSLQKKAKRPYKKRR
jgi:transposase-like protein